MLHHLDRDFSFLLLDLIQMLCVPYTFFSEIKARLWRGHVSVRERLFLRRQAMIELFAMSLLMVYLWASHSKVPRSTLLSSKVKSGEKAP